MDVVETVSAVVVDEAVEVSDEVFDAFELLAARERELVTVELAAIIDEGTDEEEAAAALELLCDEDSATVVETEVEVLVEEVVVSSPVTVMYPPIAPEKVLDLVTVIVTTDLPASLRPWWR